METLFMELKIVLSFLNFFAYITLACFIAYDMWKHKFHKDNVMTLICSALYLFNQYKYISSGEYLSSDSTIEWSILELLFCVTLFATKIEQIRKAKYTEKYGYREIIKGS